MSVELRVPGIAIPDGDALEHAGVVSVGVEESKGRGRL